MRPLKVQNPIVKEFLVSRQPQLTFKGSSGNVRLVKQPTRVEFLVGLDIPFSLRR